MNEIIEEHKTLDEVKQIMCDKYCKYPCYIKDPDDMDAICAECPLFNFEV